MKKIIPIIIISFVVLSGVGTVALSIAKKTTTIAPSHMLNIRTTNGVSTNWAGYIVETNLNSPQSHAITDIKGSWIVPAVSGPVTPDTYSASWIGIDGFSSNTVEQIGTDSNVHNGIAEYAAWYEMFPLPPVYLSMTIHAGDTMSAEVNYLGLRMFRLTLTDVTTGQTFSTTQRTSVAAMGLSSTPMISGESEHVVISNTQPFTITTSATKTTGYDIYHIFRSTAVTPMTVTTGKMGLLSGPSRSSAEWILEAPSNQNGQVLPLADFGTASFFDSQVTVNGVTGSINNAQWQNDPLTMQSPSPPVIKAQPSVLSPDGTSFTVTWQHQ
jgi:hypothetical protein